MNYYAVEEIAARTMLAIISLFVLTRLLGKKQIAQLSYYDYIVGITIGSIAGAISIDDKISVINGITSLTVWGAVSILFSYVSLKSIKVRRILEGVPTVVMKNGQIIKSNLKRERYHVNDLMEDLRGKGVFNIADVEFAILETDGTLSVLKKSQYETITPDDLNITTRYRGLCANLIIDGRIMYNNLEMVGLTREWLISELKQRNIISLRDVFLASLDSQGNLYIDLRKSESEKESVLE